MRLANAVAVLALALSACGAPEQRTDGTETTDPVVGGEDPATAGPVVTKPPSKTMPDCTAQVGYTRPVKSETELKTLLSGRWLYCGQGKSFLGVAGIEFDVANEAWYRLEWYNEELIRARGPEGGGRLVWDNYTVGKVYFRLSNNSGTMSDIVFTDTPLRMHMYPYMQSEPALYAPIQ